MGFFPHSFIHRAAQRLRKSREDTVFCIVLWTCAVFLLVRYFQKGFLWKKTNCSPKKPGGCFYGMVLNMCQKYGALDPIFSLPEYAQIPTAVVGIVMKFFQIVMSIAIGLSAGAIPIVGYNIGAGRRDRASRLMVELLCTEFAIGLCATILFDCFPHRLIAIFGAKNESVYYTDFAILCIRLFLSTTALACVNKGTFIFLQSLGKAWTSAGLSMLREVGFGVGLVLLFPLWFGLYGMLWFMAAADILTFILCVFVILRVRRELQSA